MFSRRSFLALSATATLRPASVAKAASKNDRLQVGYIGVGNQGMGLLKRFLQWDLGDVVAVCDVNAGSHGYKKEEHFYGREPAKAFVGEQVAKRRNRGSWAGCESYADFRDVLARDDVDAVVIVLPDHWHTPASVEAAAAGKHIYCEKPLTLTIAEGQQMADAVEASGVTFQVGSHERSRPISKWVCESVRDGLIGEVKTAETVVGFNNKVGPGPGWTPDPVPGTFDYQRWLGPAPMRPYHTDRCLYRFRFHYDYSGGQVTNFGAHCIDMAQWGMGRDGQAASEVACSRATFLPEGSLFNTALETDFRLGYADGGAITCRSSEEMVQVRFVGSDGWIQTGYRGTTASRDELLADAPPHDTPKGQRDAHSLHQQNFVQAVAGQASLAAPLKTGRAAADLCHLANIAIRRYPEHGEQTLAWDGTQFTNHADANEMVSRPDREWT